MYHYFHNVGKSQPTSVETLFDPRHLILYGTVYHEGTHLLSGRSCVPFYFLMWFILRDIAGIKWQHYF